MKNPYKPIETNIDEIITETSTIKTFKFSHTENIGFRTGQFIELHVPGLGEAPFTPSSDPKVNDKMDVTIMKAGIVTKTLHEIKPNTKVGIRGPYGKGYPLDDFKNKEVYIVGGGVGLAPLRSLLYALFHNLGDYKKIILRYGSRTPEDILYKSEIEEWKKKIDVVLSVDKGNDTWKGNVGVVTTILKDKDINIKNAVTIVCGPPIMMKFATFRLLEMGFLPKDIYLSMEKNMSCGIGKCGHCRIDKYYICQDGPVFTYDKIKDAHELWD